MIKTCRRCENEPKLPEIPIGQKCLEALRAELQDYESALSDPAAKSAADRRAELESAIEEARAELELLPAPDVEVVPPVDPIDLDDEARALESAEADLAREIASAEAAAIEAEAAEVGRLAREIDEATDPVVRIT